MMKASSKFIVQHSSFIVCPLESAPVKRFCAVVILAFVACGKRGDPTPPVPIIPQAASDLVVTQRGASVILSWGYPALTTAGRALRSVRRVVVYRTIEELPVAPTSRDANAVPAGDTDPTLPQSIALFAKVPPLTPTQFAKVKEKLDSLEGTSLVGATAGAKLTYEDDPPFHARDGRPVRINYAVVTEGASAKSDLSNLATIVPLDVPVPPASLTANAKPEGVALDWKAPSNSATSTSRPVLIGYNIYRASATESSDELGTPVNASPVKDTNYLDVPPYGMYRYRVSAVAAAGPPRIESDLSAPASITFKDLMPPPPPTGLTALVGTKSVRLVWDPVEAPDLRGYLIYRTEGTAKLKLTPLPATTNHFEDISVEPGIEYFYSVTSVDTSSNESAPVNTEKVLVPKTP